MLAIEKLKNIYITFEKNISRNVCFAILLIFNYIFTFLCILSPSLIIGGAFLLINTIFIFFSSSKRGLQNIFAIYPLSRVLKIPNLTTSLMTIVLFEYVIILLIKFILNCVKTKKIKENHLSIIICFIIYVLLTFVTSFITPSPQSINRLLSYYVHLSLPILCVITIKPSDKIDGVNNLIFFFLSYFLGMLYTLIFYYVIPNGQDMLVNAGVNVFDMNTAGLRFSPLSDDPNYGTASIILLSSLFLCSKTTLKQKILGFPLIALNFVLSTLTISKMFYICLVVIAFFYLLNIFIKHQTTLLAILITFLGLVCIMVFLGTPAGNSLLIRTIGTVDGIDLNRITSGRTDIFGEYTSFILNNPLTLIFGNGPLYYNPNYFSHGEHNTFTYNILGSGIIGVFIMLLVLFMMTKERYDKTTKIPANANFYAFIICLIICCMSLSISPSTVFPILVVGAQYVNLLDNKDRIISILRKGDLVININI